MTDIKARETGMFTIHSRRIDESKARLSSKNVMCTALKFVCMHVAYTQWRLILGVSQMGMILEVIHLYYKKGRQEK